MSPRSPDGRSIKGLAKEEDDREQHYFERQEPEDESDPIDKKETSWDEETVHEEFTSRRPPSPFASFLQETRDPQASPKGIDRAFEDRMLRNELLEGCTSEENRVHEFLNADLRRKVPSKSSDQAEGSNEAGNNPVQGATSLATEPDEHLNPHIVNPELQRWWINSLMWTGFKKPLEIVDLPSLPEWDDADAVHKRFSTFWSIEQQKVK
ncbi:hypothetical protein R1sor_021794 [Riccia sorocarpa]|uniref:Uncharacterized protein n=1 Tax=Riccia sorocarpa TaxID=122646 RepID=A0ABD3GI21_9MARC